MPAHSGVQGEIGRPTSPTLHLRPLSHDAQRLWQIGGAVPDVREPDGDKYVLTVRPDFHENFASLRAILNQLAPHARPEHHADLARLDTYLREAAPDFGDNAADTHGRFLADSVTLAIMRRISRESVYTSRVIETGARVMNAILSTSVACPRVCVPCVDRLDRPTLKVLARAMLLLDKGDRFSWVWQLSTDPTIDTDDAARDRYVTSRTDMLRKLVGICRRSSHDTEAQAVCGGLPSTGLIPRSRSRRRWSSRTTMHASSGRTICSAARTLPRPQKGCGFERWRQ